MANETETIKEWKPDSIDRKDSSQTSETGIIKGFVINPSVKSMRLGSGSIGWGVDINQGMWCGGSSYNTALTRISISRGSIITKEISGTGTGTLGLVVKNPKNTSSGSNKQIEINIQGTPYYYLAYPSTPTTTDYTLKGATPSENLQYSCDTERTTTSTTYQKKKSIKTQITGVFRVKYDLKIDSGPTSVFGALYLNGSLYGGEDSTNSTIYVTYSHDIPLLINDTIEIWIRQNNTPGSNTAYVRNFRLYYDRATVSEGSIVYDA